MCEILFVFVQTKIPTKKHDSVYRTVQRHGRVATHLQKPGKVREFQSGQEKMKKIGKVGGIEIRVIVQSSYH